MKLAPGQIVRWNIDRGWGPEEHGFGRVSAYGGFGFYKISYGWQRHVWMHRSSLIVRQGPVRDGGIILEMFGGRLGPGWRLESIP